MSSNDNRMIIYDKTKKTGYKIIPPSPKKAPKPKRNVYSELTNYLNEIGDEGKYETVVGNIIRLNTGVYDADDKEILLYLTYSEEKDKIVITLLDDDTAADTIGVSDVANANLGYFNRVVNRTKKKFPERIYNGFSRDDKGLSLCGNLEDYVYMKWFMIEVLTTLFDHV